MLNSAAATRPRQFSAREYFRYVESFDEPDRTQALEAASIVEPMNDVLLDFERRGALVLGELVFLGEGI